MEVKTLTCISCPLGCELTVSLEDGEVKTVTGNQCRRGVVYAKAECVHPVRMLCTTVPLRGGTVERLPVKSGVPIPKAMVTQCSRALAGVEADAPVVLGQVIVADICGTGVDIIATRSVPAVSTEASQNGDHFH